MHNLLPWLKNPKRTYTDGLTLLKSFNHKDLPYYSKFENPDAQSFQFRMLYSIIKNLARIQAQHPAAIPETKIPDQKLPHKVKTPGIIVVSNPIVDVKELPENLSSLYFQNKALTKEISQDHVQLKSVKTDTERKTLLDGIIEKESTRASNWKAIDAWWLENKNQKADPPEEISDKKQIQQETLLLIKKTNALKINISRATKEMKLLTGKKAENRKLKIENWKKQLSELEIK
ncbi:MAG: hypothetical protein K0B15_06525 [Lentimicrobium sp.]|nr:hypothetical protein [Lentimicrobium sp.]